MEAGNNELWLWISEKMCSGHCLLTGQDGLFCGGVTVLAASCVALLVCLVMLCRDLCLWWRGIKEERGNHRGRAFLWWALCTFAGGFLLYLIGFFWEGTAESFFSYLIRPFLSSLEMFVSKSDLLEVSPECKENPVYMTWFSIIHFSAVAVSASFAINCFWRRIVSGLRLCRWRLCGNGKHIVNVFWGMDDKSMLLARDLYRNRERGERFVFIDMPHEVHEVAQRLSFSHVFGLFSYRREQLEKAGNMKYVLMHSAVRPGRMERADGHVLDILGLHTLGRLVDGSEEARVFVLADDEAENVRSVMNLMRSGALNRKNVRFYCRAGHGAANEFLEAGHFPASVRIVDESCYAVEALKLMPRTEGKGFLAHPVNFVEVCRDKGTVTSAFTAMIIGLGTTGQEVMRFLYEFASFVGEDGRKTPFSCHVYDGGMERIRASLQQEIPALPALERSGEVSLHNYGTDSGRFWEELEHLAETLNYVVIATGDDAKEMELAVRISGSIARNSQGKRRKFHIFIRSNKMENELQMERTAKYYEENDTGVFTVFGQAEHIYSKAVLVDNGLMEMSKDFYEAYRKTAVATCGDAMLSWEERHEQEPLKKRYATRMAGFRGLRRQERQDMSNCLHAYTKEVLLGLPERRVQFSLPAFPFDMAEPGISQEERRWRECLYNVSVCEHLRWNASHYMMGYTGMAEEKVAKGQASCDEVVRQHRYIVDWEALSVDIQRYDYIVVQTTLAAYKQKGLGRVDKEVDDGEKGLRRV